MKVRIRNKIIKKITKAHDLYEELADKDIDSNLAYDEILKVMPLFQRNLYRFTKNERDYVGYLLDDMYLID